MREKLEGITFSDPNYPVVSNVTAEPVREGGEARELLATVSMSVRLAVETACRRQGVRATTVERMRLEDEVFEREAYARTGQARERLEAQWDGHLL